MVNEYLIVPFPATVTPTGKRASGKGSQCAYSARSSLTVIEADTRLPPVRSVIYGHQIGSQ